MIDYYLNIGGSEWVIIIFAALILILGTNKLPEVAKKLGKATNEYNKAKKGFEDQIKDVTDTNIHVSGPVENERQKLEAIAKTLNVDCKDKTDQQLRDIISSKMSNSDKNKF